MHTFQSPQTATATAKRLMREQAVSTVTAVRTSRCANGRFMTAIFLDESTPAVEYDTIDRALSAFGFEVHAHVDTNWIAAVSLMP